MDSCCFCVGVWLSPDAVEFMRAKQRQMLDNLANLGVAAFVPTAATAVAANSAITRMQAEKR